MQSHTGHQNLMIQASRVARQLPVFALCVLATAVLLSACGDAETPTAPQGVVIQEQEGSDSTVQDIGDVTPSRSVTITGSLRTGGLTFERGYFGDHDIYRFRVGGPSTISVTITKDQQRIINPIVVRPITKDTAHIFCAIAGSESPLTFRAFALDSGTLHLVMHSMDSTISNLGYSVALSVQSAAATTKISGRFERDSSGSSEAYEFYTDGACYQIPEGQIFDVRCGSYRINGGAITFLHSPLALGIGGGQYERSVSFAWTDTTVTVGGKRYVRR